MEDKIGIYDIFERFINVKTLDDIIKYNGNNKELVQFAYEMREFLSFYYEIVMSTTDLDSLRSVANYLLDNSSLVNDIRLYFSDIKEKIKKIYEMEANNNLTQLDNLPDKAKVSSIEYRDEVIEYIDLSSCKHAFYAHVISPDFVFADLLNPILNGRRIMSLTPITHIGKRLYDTGFALLYNKIPDDGFIGSSSCNMGSNYYVKTNSLDTRFVESKFYQLSFKDSSAMGDTNDNPETLVIREGMVPVAVMIRGDVPSDSELECAIYFQNALGCKFPVVKTQNEGTVASLDDVYVPTDCEHNYGNFFNNLEYLKRARGVLTSRISRDDVYGIFRRQMGGSHDIYECRLNGEDDYFLLKPGMRKDKGTIDPYRSYAVESAYKIQKLVNPENSVEVKIVNAPVGPNDSNIVCAALKYIPNTTNYEGWMGSSDVLKSDDVRWFMKEFICDHLLFNYDTKGANFLKDEFGRNYGIDKEQALKFAVDSRFINTNSESDEKFKTEFVYDFDPNGVGIIYDKIFTNYIEGTQEIDDSVFLECLDICRNVSDISDSQYISYFEKFIDSFVLNNGSDIFDTRVLKNLLIESILARKNNLVLDYQEFVLKIKSMRFNKGFN